MFHRPEVRSWNDQIDQMERVFWVRLFQAALDRHITIKNFREAHFNRLLDAPVDVQKEECKNRGHSIQIASTYYKRERTPAQKAAEKKFGEKKRKEREEQRKNAPCLIEDEEESADAIQMAIQANDQELNGVHWVPCLIEDDCWTLWYKHSTIVYSIEKCLVASTLGIGTIVTIVLKSFILLHFVVGRRFVTNDVTNQTSFFW